MQFNVNSLNWHTELRSENPSFFIFIFWIFNCAYIYLTNICIEVVSLNIPQHCVITCLPHMLNIHTIGAIC